MSRSTATEIAKREGISPQAVGKKMSRNGYRMDSRKRYSDEEWERAKAVGAQADKAAAAKQLSECGDDTLQAKLLKKKIQRLDVDIETAKAKLDEMLGKVIPIEDHKDKLLATQRMMILWWSQAAENAATKVKDAQILEELRRAGERASKDIMEIV